MGKRISPTAIGLFVSGSLVLVVTAIVLLGAGNLFRKQHNFVCFFQGSLNGLKVGAPVKVRGVQIGSVTQILLRLPPDDGILKHKEAALSALPVIIDIDESQLKRYGGTGEALQRSELDSLIKSGLRAQLGTESLLTGLLYVDIDLHPNTRANFALEPDSGRYPEIPTVPTDLEQVQETAMRALAKLDKIDFDALIQSMTNAANSANALLSSQDLKETLASLKLATANLNKTIVSADRDLNALNVKMSPLITSMKKTSDDADATMIQAKSTMADLQAVIAPDSPLKYRLDLALDNMSQASGAIRQLADFLQRNPSALIRGRYAPDHQQ